MKTDMLREYAEKELETAKQLATQIATAEGGFKPNLRRLYGLPIDTRLIYAESGGLSNINYFPEDTKVIIPIFPWNENELQAKIGPLNELRTLIDAGRILPIIQQPEYYCGYDHLKFLFERNTPSYFIRGSFALSAALGTTPEIEKDGAGIITLSAITRLMTHCDKVHQYWLQYALKHERCWEHRYRESMVKGFHDDRFYKRLYSSLRYRYASVAFCIGQYIADQIISVFPPDKASSILLHLHILFDHLICHGVGSDFVVRSNTPEGIDFQYSRRTSVARPHESVLAEDLEVSLPERDDDYVRGLLREEHFLREINFALVSSQSVRDIQDQLSRQFGIFREKGERYAKGKKFIESKVQITLYILSSASVAATLVGTPLDKASLAAFAGYIAGLKVPWLADIVANSLEKLHRDKLASYIIKLHEQGPY